MFTPQQIQEQTFSKAVFGGYDMQQVDDFLEPLSDDYIALYKENSVLKAKMKILVEKLEEYRAQEAQLKQSAAEAQASRDRMLAEAKAQCDEMLKNARSSVQEGQAAQAVKVENDRIDFARKTALNFIEVIESDIKGHLELLEKLKSRDLISEKEKDVTAAMPKRQHEKPFDYEADSFRTAPTPTTQDIASEISENLVKLVGTPESESASAPSSAPVQMPPQRPYTLHPDSATIKFTDLQFGKNYDPTK